jgi:two-component system phosphate regulon sensor histidine kinase PhoR
VHLGGLIEECLELIRPQLEEDALQLEVVLDDSMTPVQVDRNRMKQVILNLLNNAIKYNIPGGKVIIRVYQEGAQAIMEFEDTGRGIPADSMPHIFDRFYRVPYQEETIIGSGLGLTIVKRIVENHQGEIKVQSKVGEGSRFIVYLPSSTPSTREC